MHRDLGVPGIVHLVPVILTALFALTVARNVELLGPPLTAARAERLSGPADRAVPAQHQHARLSPFFSPEVAAWFPHIERWSRQADLPISLIATVIQLESCGDPYAISSSGALGLFQVMPYHFASDERPLDVSINASAGLSYLKGAWVLADGDARLTLAGYNGGHGVIARPTSEWPEETRRYVQWGSGLLADIERGRRPSPTLQAWLDVGGRHLCRQAASRPLSLLEENY